MQDIKKAQGRKEDTRQTTLDARKKIFKW